jgi:serine/threonine protein kinase
MYGSLTLCSSSLSISTVMDPRMTHVSNFAAGTPFYRAPEIVHKGQASTSSDVYAFGVLMIEVFTSLPPSTLHKRYSKEKLAFEGHTSSTAEPMGEPRPCDFLRQVLQGIEEGGLVGDEWLKHEPFVSYRKLAFQCLEEDSKSRPDFQTILSEVQRMMESYPTELKDKEQETDKRHK